MKIFIISIICILVIIGGYFIINSFNTPPTPNNNNSQNILVLENNINNINATNVTKISVGVFNNSEYNTSLDTDNKIDVPQTETQLSSFSTKVLTKDPNRNNNISITCEKINEHIVKAGETFSFTSTVGKATTSKGYEKANMFTSDGDTFKGLGGGNCQVSSTLYNAVLAVDGLKVTERHSHSSKVYYVPDGKDAAVAYGSIDFKFKNELDYDVKILSTSSTKEVKIRLVRV